METLGARISEAEPGRVVLELAAGPQHRHGGGVVQGGVITHAIVVSISITTLGTLLSMLVTTGLAYGLSRPVVGRKPLLMLALLSLLFQPGIIPSYLVVKQLGMLNTYASLVVPVALNGFNLVVMRQFFLEIPHELIDSARIDGAGELRILWQIVLPLSGAVLAVELSGPCPGPLPQGLP